MELLPYTALVAQMLKDHFGIRLTDTQLTEDKINLARLNGIAPYEVVNQQAVDRDLRRIDLAKENAFPRALLSNADQYRAVLKLTLQIVRDGMVKRPADKADLH